MLLREYKLTVEKKQVINDNLLVKENSKILGWYNIKSLINFLNSYYYDKNFEINFFGLNKIEKNEINAGLEKLLKENKKIKIRFLER